MFVNKKCYKKCLDSGLHYTNGISTKLLQSQMINTTGKNKITYNNSNTNTINAIIISADIYKNKQLLFKLCHRVYFNYFEPLSILYPSLLDMLNSILLSLTDAEYEKIFQIKKLAPIIEPLKTAEIIKNTYYVVCNNVKENYSYFIFKNFTIYDVFLPTYSYKFDVSHPSNRDNILSFSQEQDYVEYTYIKRIGEPGVDVDACVILTFPFDISRSKMYIYNRALSANVINKLYSYKIGGYTLEYISIAINTVASKIISKCKGNSDVLLAIQPFIPKDYDIPRRDEFTPIKCLKQSSIFSVTPYNGLNIVIIDISNKKTSIFYNTAFYGLSNGGEYYIFVPKTYQLAFLNKDQTTNFSYIGDDDKKTTETVIGTDKDGTYDFYYGTIKITINGLFQNMSVYTLNFGYLGGYERFVYTDKCLDTIANFSSEPELIRF